MNTRKTELEILLAILEDKLFMVNMVDRWTDADRNLYHKTKAEIAAIKAELAEM